MADIEIEYAYAEPELFPSILAFWEIRLRGKEPVTDLLHPEPSTIRMPLSGHWSFGATASGESLQVGSIHLHGTTSRSQWVCGSGGSAFCIALSPAAWIKLLNTPAWPYSDRMVPLSKAVGDRAATLAGAISATSGFAARVAAASQVLMDWQHDVPHKIDSEFVTMLNVALDDPDLATVDEVAGRMRMSQAKLARIARNSHGFTPKYLIRRARFLRMLHIMEARPYAEWPDFIDTQYVDQSHMIRDFKDFLGLAPSRYFALDRPILTVAADAIKIFLASKQVPNSSAIGRSLEDG